MQSLISANIDLNVQAGANFTFFMRRFDGAGNVRTFPGYTPRLVAKKALTDAIADAVYDFSGSPEIFFDSDWNLFINLDATQTDLVGICCLYYAVSLVSDTNPDTDVLSYSSGQMNINQRADTILT